MEGWWLAEGGSLASIGLEEPPGLPGRYENAIPF